MAIKIPGIQGLLHEVEQGRLAGVFRLAALLAVVATLAIFYLFIQFKGLREPDAMDQAQIARSLASGDGYSTDYIRPLAVWQLEAAKKKLPERVWPDFTQQPLQPALLAPFFFISPELWTIGQNEVLSSADYVIAGMGICFFLAACAVFFFVGRLLFDQRVAAVGVTALVLTDLFWQFSMSGLPQMLLLLLFAVVSLLSVQALQAREEGRPYFLKLILATACFALMVLAHGLAVWIFFGWLAFWLVLLRRQFLKIALLAALLGVLVSPWMIRNYTVCGNPFGLNIYTALWAGNDPERNVMRQGDPNFGSRLGGLRKMVKDGTMLQFNNIFRYLGLNVLAVIFFISLLHAFRNQTSSTWRWAVLAMWATASGGMAIFGISSDPVSSNQMHILFVPLMVFYGTAFLLVMWGRLEIQGEFFRRVFLGTVFAICAIPMISSIFFGGGGRIQWPPYIPPFIAVLGNWFSEDEIICSDMPWAVAWYANRKSVLLPDTPNRLIRYNDYRVLGNSIAGLYLTPLTGNLPLISQIYKGGYKDWAGLITRPPQTRGFFLPAFTPLPMEGECIIFADTERWAQPR